MALTRQPGLDFEPHAHARTSDPETSHEAAALVNASEMQQRVLAIYRDHPNGLTDEELVAIYAQRFSTGGRSLESRSSPRKRRSDLANANLLVDSGQRRPLASGRNGVVWRVADPA